MLAQLRPAFILFALLTLITGLVYPLAMTGVAQALFPVNANGNLLVRQEGVVGSRLIGQSFTSERYFWPRPSAAGNGYDASASSGANLGPTTDKLLERISADAQKVKSANGTATLPADAVTASGSGLDPDISEAYALIQAGRVAEARNRPVEEVKALVEHAVRKPFLGVFGEPHVNVLKLNLALDAQPPA